MARKEAERLISRFSEQRILVVGDLMLDRYVAGTVNRISPEAPVPVVRVTGEHALPGGAANVAANIRASRPPDSYHGKGVRYQGEFIRLKPGKAAAAR